MQRKETITCEINTENQSREQNFEANVVTQEWKVNSAKILKTKKIY